MKDWIPPAANQVGAGPHRQMVGVGQHHPVADLHDSWGAIALTTAWVPTGMKAGVSTRHRGNQAASARRAVAGQDLQCDWAFHHRISIASP